jgi:predicted AlkP superfamily pyrophosphatase or phosphodiesterase
MVQTGRIRQRAALAGAVLVLALLVLALASLHSRAEVAAAQRDAPTRGGLIVLLVVDQMRADYIDRFAADWSGGLKHLLEGGAWFTNALYPYLTTVTCPGHATVSTGAFPHLHGIFQNAWHDRAEGRTVTCTEDRSAVPVSYGAAKGVGDSAAKLLIPSLADELRAQRGARVVAVSLKARSAIMLAGHGGDAVTWLTEGYDAWETSSAFAREPVPAVVRFLADNPVEADAGRSWVRQMPETRYLEPDGGEGEQPPRGWTRLFPHTLAAPQSSEFRRQWATSPFADAYVGRFAASLADAMQLGQSSRLDVLAVSFSASDIVGHAFGPWSQEVQDLYAQLDRTIGALLAHLEAAVGKDRLIVALSSDHGVTPIPEQLGRRGLDGGRVSTARLGDAIERTAAAIFGPGRYVARVNGNDIYLQPGTYERLSASPSRMRAVVDAMAAQPGIARVFRREELASGGRSADALLQMAALSYVARRSGDLVVALKPGWMFAAGGTTHGTANPDDRRVPLIIMGPQVATGRYDRTVTPADLAPTLAKLAGIVLPRAEGRPLEEALVVERPASAR